MGCPGKSGNSIRYEIHICGKLDQKWSEWFADFSITPINDETILQGEVADQSALFGILTKIHDLGLPIVSVERKPGLKGRNHGKNGDPYSITGP